MVPNAFGRVLFSSKYVLRQTRGMYGLGVKMAVLYGQMTTGRPVEVVTSRRGHRRIYYFKLRIDVNRNEPVVVEKGSWSKTVDWHGTIVSLTIEGDWSRAKQKIKEYLFKTAVAVPYANIVALTPEDELIYYPRITEVMPPPPVEVKPHPHGVDFEMLKHMVSTGSYNTIKDLLIGEFQGIGEVTAERILSQVGIEPVRKPGELSDGEILALVNTLKVLEGVKPPSARAISPLGKELIEASLKRVFQPEFVYAVSRRPQAYHGHPFAVEVGLAYGGGTPLSESDKPIILRYANKIPLLYDEGSDVATLVVKEDIDWGNYMISFPAPLAVLVHVCSTKVPFKGVGKESIADVPEVRREIKLSLMEALRELRKHLLKKAREEDLRRKAERIAKYIPEVVRSIASVISSNDKSIESKLAEKLVVIVSKRTGIPAPEILSVLETVEVGG